MNAIVPLDLKPIRDALETQQARILEIPEGAGREKAMVLVKPPNYAGESLKKVLDEFRTTPQRSRSISKHDTLASFCDAVLAFGKHSTTAIYAELAGDTVRFTAYFDHDSKNGDTIEPGWFEHQAVYEPRHSPEWQKWVAAQANPMNQAEFAEFIEDVVHHVVNPDGLEISGILEQAAFAVGGKYASPSALAAVSRNVRINESAAVASAVNLATGEQQIVWQTEHKNADSTIMVPRLFCVAIPVVLEGSFYRVPVRLRYRVNAGRVTWTVALFAQDQIVRDSNRGLLEEISGRVGVSARIFEGSMQRTNSR